MAVNSKTTPPFNDNNQDMAAMPKQRAEQQENSKETEDNTGQTTPEDQYISGMKLYALITSIALCFVLITLDMSIIATAIPYITSQFHSLGDVGWYGSAYQLACASLLPLAGKLYSNFKPKYTFLAYFAIFELGSLLCGVATSSKMLIVGRVVAGIGGSGLMNGGMTITSASIPLYKRPKYYGIMMGISKMGVVCGPLLGGAFTSYVSWRWCFYINLPIGAIVAIILWFVHVPQTPKPRAGSVLEIIRTKLDLVGFVLFAPAAIQFFLALEYGGGKYRWDSSVVIGLFCGAGATAILFLFWEWHQGDNAMTPFSIIKLLPVWSSCVVMMLLFGCLQTAAFYLPIYFQTVKQVSPMLSGVYTLPSIISQLIFAILAGIGNGRLGYYLPFTLASATLLSISNGLLSTFSPKTSTGKWIGYQILLGVAQGLGMQAPFIAVQNSIPPTMIPVAMAMLSFTQTFSGSVYLAIDETLFTNSLASNISKYASDVDTATVMAAGASASGVVQAVDGDRSKLAGVLMAYSKSVDNIFYLTAGSAALIFGVSWGMGMKDIRRKGEKRIGEKVSSDEEDPKVDERP